MESKLNQIFISTKTKINQTKFNQTKPSVTEPNRTTHFDQIFWRIWDVQKCRDPYLMHSDCFVWRVTNIICFCVAYIILSDLKHLRFLIGCCVYPAGHGSCFFVFWIFILFGFWNSCLQWLRSAFWYVPRKFENRLHQFLSFSSLFCNTVLISSCLIFPCCWTGHAFLQDFPLPQVVLLVSLKFSQHLILMMDEEFVSTSWIKDKWLDLTDEKERSSEESIPSVSSIWEAKKEKK